MASVNAIDGLIDLLEELVANLSVANEPSKESKILHSQLDVALKNDQLDEFISEAERLGKKIQDIFNSVIIDNANELLEKLYDAWANLNKSVNEFLEYVFAAIPSALDDICQYIIGTIGRKMNQQEETLAKSIYGSSLDYNKIYFSKKDLSNVIIFGIQDFFTQNPNSRAFVTFNLVNHDVSDPALLDETFIHELCHVWQYQHVGPIYLIEALHAHVTLNDAYDYGYTNSYNGNGGQTALTNAISNNSGLTTAEVFELFNPEQQATIIEHYFVRKYVEFPPLNVAAWQPFKDLVHSP